MSHVDDGTLHAYLDGELTPVESERLDAHLAACQACRARLEEERALIERASKLLSRAVPPTPERAAPPLHQLRRPRVAWRLRMPLAWAATVLMAVGIGWFLRGPTTALRLGASDSRLDSAPIAQPAAEAPAIALNTRPMSTPGGHPEQRRSNDSESAQGYRPAGAGADRAALADRVAPDDRSSREEADERPPVAKAADHLARDSANSGLRAAPAAPVAGNAIVGTAAPPDAARDAPARRRLSTVWPVIEPRPARDLLGAAPAAIPGIPIRAMRRNPAAAAEIVVEQEIDSGVVVHLFQKRMDTAADALHRQAEASGLVSSGLVTNERLARFVGSLRIEIAGPLTTDSLSRLLELVTPTTP
jgi:hypothetical protein